jgi:hypothetical protein
MASIRFPFRLTLAGMAALSLAATTAPAFAGTPFDGSWSVLIVTQKGDCDRGYRYPVQISNGTVGYSGQADFTVKGRVTAEGAISVTVSRGDRSAHGSGRLAGNSGTGAWKAGECSGIWTAERRQMVSSNQ